MVEWNTADVTFKVSAPERSMEFTGERMTTAIEGEIEFEHFHRYCLARDLCLGLDVLDVASGEGYGSSILAKVARSVIALDVDPAAIAHVHTPYGGENLRFVQGSALDLPLGDASVDAVVSFETLEHVREHARFMSEVKRVLRPGGKLIVSTPERAVYSDRDESVNKYHLLELTLVEFNSLLRANFRYVSILSQRAILGSLIVKTEGGGPWRSYERRSLEYIEASSGLTRARFLVAIASDEEILQVPSSVYLDRRRPDEAVGAYLQLPGYRSQAIEMSAEIGRLSEVVATRDAEIKRLNDAASPLNVEIRRLHDALSARGRELSSVKSERDGQIVWLSDDRTRLNGQLDAYAARLDALQGRFDEVTRSFRWRLVDGLVHLPRTVGRILRRPFVRVAFHKDRRPRGPLRGSGSKSGATPASLEIVSLDRRKATILVVSHQASRSGAPILSLNIIQQFSPRYNVVSLLLDGGELIDHFRRASASLYVIDRNRITEQELDNVINKIATESPLIFAIINSVESGMVLRALKARDVPTVSLIHEFSSYTRPRSVFPNVINLSTETVFSTNITLENAVSDLWLYQATSIHLLPQGKCTVPACPGPPSDASRERAWLTRNLRPEGGSRKFLVLGLGRVELRKGVDLFIECATIVKNQPGGERFQFVWMGSGFDPEHEITYSVYVDDQIKRAGIGSQMKILRATSQIELAYQVADVLLLSSRLDPLPNVAIDALSLGLPVVCFEKTTGVADFLSESGLGGQCVAKYLDTHDLASKVMALADSDALRASVSERSRAAAKCAFDMNSYVSKIETIGLKAVGNAALVKKEVDTIRASGKFRADFFRDPEMESVPEEKLIEDYVGRMASGLGIRKPMPGFQPTVYSWLHRQQETKSDPFADFLRKGLPEGPWLQDVIQNGCDCITAPEGELRAALHLHVFYQDKLPSIVERLGLNTSTPDLFISAASEDVAAETREALSTYRGRIADLRVTPNLGRDIGPLLTLFGRDLCASYDFIGHLHTKKSVDLANSSFAEAWNAFLLENLVGGKHGGAMLDLILYSMSSNPAIGIVFPDDPHVVSWTANRKHADELATRMRWGELPEQFNFPIGSMFWMRSAMLKRFVELNLALGEYSPEPLPSDGTMVHAIERLLGIAPATMGMTCAVTNVRGITR
jgi:glycosyltransferase involved in cell wall biosynthesis/SAM-dependent methyltransferase